MEKIRRHMSSRSEDTLESSIRRFHPRSWVTPDPGAASSRRPLNVNVPSLEFVISPTVGGQGGNDFDDQATIPDPNVESINAIKMEVSREYVDSIQLWFSDGSNGAFHGNHANVILRVQTFQVRESEYVNKVIIWSDTHLRAIQFGTDTGRLSAKFGKPTGKVTELNAPENHKLVCFKGKSGTIIDSPAAVWHPIEL